MKAHFKKWKNLISDGWDVFISACGCLLTIMGAFVVVCISLLVAALPLIVTVTLAILTVLGLLKIFSIL